MRSSSLRAARANKAAVKVPVHMPWEGARLHGEFHRYDGALLTYKGSAFQMSKIVEFEGLQAKATRLCAQVWGANLGFLRARLGF